MSALSYGVEPQSEKAAVVIDWEATVEIRTLAEALAWGEEWERAYLEERRARLLEIKRMQNQIFELEHALKVKEFESFVDSVLG